MKKKQQIQINKAMKLLSSSYRTDINSVRINVHNKLKHELAKLMVAYDLILDGHYILTEAIFKNKVRADIFVLDTFQVYEIMFSETEKKANEKLSYYPEDVDILFVKADEVINSHITS